MDIRFNTITTTYEHLAANSLPHAMDWKIVHNVIVTGETLPVSYELPFIFNVKVLRNIKLSPSQFRWWQLDKAYIPVGQPMDLLDGRAVWRWHYGSVGVHSEDPNQELRTAIGIHAESFPFKFTKSILEAKLMEAFDDWTCREIGVANKFLEGKTDLAERGSMMLETLRNHPFLDYIRTRR